MNETVKTPTVAELRKAGYGVRVTHNRVYKMAYNDFASGKIVVKNSTNPISTLKKTNIDCNSDGVLYELLPKGGVTEVTVIDPVSNLEFTASAACRDSENYNKEVGVERCLSRIIDLMRICEYQDKTFKIRVGTK